MSSTNDTAEEWEVHVTGPDDVLPAENYADAVRQANEINVFYETHTVPGRTEYHPFMWASPVRKGFYTYPLSADQLRKSGVFA